MLTETEAREKIAANGFDLRQRGNMMEALEGGRASPRVWTGMSCIDLVKSFGLDKRKAKPLNKE